MTKAAIRDWLIGEEDIQDAVESRVFPGHIPQGVSGTSIVITKITGDHDYHLGNEIQLVRNIYQLDIYDDGLTPWPTVEELTELIRLRLSGYRGQLNDDVFCHGAFIIRDNEFDERPADSSDQWKARESLDFEIHTTAAAPTH